MHFEVSSRRGASLPLLFGFALCVLAAGYTMRASLEQITLYARDLPYWDHFGYFDSFRHWREGDWNFWTFFHMTHNEHRLGLTKLTMLADLYWTRGSNRVLLATTFLLLFVSGGLIMATGAKGRSTLAAAGLSLLGAASMVGIVSLGNLAWPTQVQFGYAQIVPILLFMIAFSPLSLRIKTPAVALLAVIAAETMASGILAPLAGFLAALLFARDRTTILLLLGAFLLSLLYYSFPTAHDFPVGPKHGFTYDNLVYYFAAAGNWAQRGGVVLSIGTGIAVTALAAIICLVSLRQAPIVDRSLLVLLAIALYEGGSIAAMAINRGTAGNPEWALTSRYSTPAIALALAVTALVLRLGYLRNAKPLGWIGAGFIACILFFTSYSQRAIEDMAHITGQIDVATKMMRDGGFDAEVYKKIYPSPDVLRDMVQFMRDHRYSIFRK